MTDTYLLIGKTSANVWQVIKKDTQEACESYLIENYDSLNAMYLKLAIPTIEDFAASCEIRSVTKPTVH
jgi:hypothetical protein